MDKIKLKRLISKYNYLDIYLQEIKIQYKIYNQTFLKEYYELNPDELSNKSENKDNKEDKENKDKENKDDKDNKEDKDKENKDDKDNKEDKENIDEEIKINIDNDKNDLDPEIRDILNKLYRKISLKIHPDKPNGDNEKFIKALNAYKSNNILELIILADLYNIDYSLNENVFSYIEKEIDTLDHKINELQHHVCWLWCNADEETKRKFKLPK